MALHALMPAKGAEEQAALNGAISIACVVSQQLPAHLIEMHGVVQKCARTLLRLPILPCGKTCNVTLPPCVHIAMTRRVRCPGALLC